jgi:hypothetical protein
MAPSNGNLSDLEMKALTNPQIAAAVRENKVTARIAADFLLKRAGQKLDRQIAKAAKA